MAALRNKYLSLSLCSAFKKYISLSGINKDEILQKWFLLQFYRGFIASWLQRWNTDEIYINLTYHLKDTPLIKMQLIGNKTLVLFNSGVIIFP